MLNLMRWYVSPAGGNKTKNTPTTLWNPATDDMDRKPITFWIDDLDVAYSTSSPAYTGAENGFPAGNLNAFPDQKNAWENGLDPVGVEKVGSLPSEFSLSQNYPNPFNPTTMIKYSIPAQSNVTLKIYDVLGSEVATLINNEVQSVGQYEVNFDASRLSSGIYFYTLNSGNFVQTKKMILLK
ncbi:MAG: T9SS type A sorting domain-containing protein [Ignavibacteriales bacterium]|nr:T9SS type A sorting domain-containing protein [Ignavibacteriota bacterium]MCB9250151.1 T9SS type A sorting domain-containing protein [Ignavibacteriales bacterium]